MKRIHSLKQLLELAPGMKFWVIRNGNCLPFIYVSPHPKTKELAIAINDGNHKKATVFGQPDFQINSIVYTGQYDSKTIGGAMIDQLQVAQKSIQNIYLDPKINTKN